ncbi:MAG: hypothetical protein CSB55_07660 [Candidatus Cloacimonadota bacterium]|nr:MAG: hypothetical protein CSB55_07660 [Candidatus Cloacimonadota bacterium]
MKIFLFCLFVASAVFLSANPNILVTGYWDPTGQMIAPFSTDPDLNPNGWIGENWEDYGYDVYSFFPEPGTYQGDFEVDYQNTSADFWEITAELQPIAIISFGAGNGPWEIECNARNLTNWYNDYVLPYQPTPNPPDSTAPVNFVRHSTLPVHEIEEVVDNETSINAWVDANGNPGAFLCEYLAYHGMWYQSIHADSGDEAPCLAAGFIHVNNSLPLEECEDAAKHTIRTVLQYLNGFTGISGIVGYNGSPESGTVSLAGNNIFFQTVANNSNGFYSLPLVPSGDYSLNCVKDNEYFTISEISVSPENNVFDIELEPAELLAEINWHNEQNDIYQIEYEHTLDALIRFHRETSSTAIIGEINFPAPSDYEISDLTVLIYESGYEADEPDDIIYEKEVTGYEAGEMITHYPEFPVTIDSDKDYWVGYRIHTTDGNVGYYDNGPIIEENGAWLKDGGWFTLEERAGIDANWMIDCKVYDHFGTYNDDNNIPSAPAVSIRNYPNPFVISQADRNKCLKIAFSVPKAGKTEINVYNVKGQKVASLLNKNIRRGDGEVIWNLSESSKAVASGIYFCRIKQGAAQAVSKLLLIK